MKKIQQAKYSALDIANYFILKARSKDKPLTNKKLQKLLYYAQAWSVTIPSKSLFTEKIEAWVHGPAILTVYNAFSEYGPDDFSKSHDLSNFNSALIDEDDKELLDSIWDLYGKHDAEYLEILSHSEDPWIKAREGLEPNQPSNNEITIQSMKDFYGQKIR